MTPDRRDLAVRLLGVAVVVLFFTAPWLTISHGYRLDLFYRVEIESWTCSALMFREAGTLVQKGLVLPIRAFEASSPGRESVELELLLACWATLLAASALLALAPRRFERSRFGAAVSALACAITLADVGQLGPAVLTREWGAASILAAPIIFECVVIAAAIVVTALWAPRAGAWLARVAALLAVVDAIAIESHAAWGELAVVALLAAAVWLLPPPAPRLAECDSAPTTS